MSLGQYAFLLALLVAFTDRAAAEISSADYPSLQAAIDANPGRIIRVSDGRHPITSALRVTTDGSGLCGHATIEQANPEQPILLIDGAGNVRIEALTFTRQADQRNATQDGILCRNCEDVVLDSVRVLDNRSHAAAIRFERCANSAVRNAQVVNYKRVSIDDRTANELQGYAFHCIDGAGICVNASIGTTIESNYVVERVLIPTPELVERFQLGKLTDGRNPTRLGELGRRAVEGDHVNNWHQGSAIVVTGPMETKRTLIRGNRIENAAQAVDMHCDDTICANNVIDHCVIGLKATHGCRNLILTGNLIAHVDLWGIVINPGAASSLPKAAREGNTAAPANVDAAMILMGNIISEYGMGHEYWNWGGRHSDRGSSYAIAFLAAQLESNPPLRDVLIQGNIVYNSVRDEPVSSTPERPRYRFAVYVEPSVPPPEGLRFLGNTFHPGTQGISNIDLETPR